MDFNFSNFIKYIILILCTFGFPALNVAQLSEVPCICETTSLELRPMIEKPKIVLISDPGFESIRWEYGSTETFESEPVNEAEVVENKPQEIIRQRSRRTDFSRKRKSIKRVKLKQKRFKKYKGQCPVF